MPPKPRKIILAVSGIMLIGSLVSGFLDWRGSPLFRTWAFVLNGLLLLNQLLILLMLKLYPGNRPVPNPLIGLFPKPEQPQKDDKQ